MTSVDTVVDSPSREETDPTDDYHSGLLDCPTNRKQLGKEINFCLNFYPQTQSTLVGAPWIHVPSSGYSAHQVYLGLHLVYLILRELERPHGDDE